MRRATRRLVALVTLLGVLTLQASVAAHACAVALAPATAVHHATAEGKGTDCGGMKGKATDVARALCLEHCQQGSDVNNTAASLDPAAIAPAAFLVPMTAAPHLPDRGRAAVSLTALANAPPPLLLSRRLRI